MSDATHDTLREQLAAALEPWLPGRPVPGVPGAADAVMVVFAERERQATSDGYVMGAKHASERAAERERLLHERIEALRPRSSATGAGRSGYNEAVGDVLAVFDA